MPAVAEFAKQQRKKNRKQEHTINMHVLINAGGEKKGNNNTGNIGYTIGNIGD